MNEQRQPKRPLIVAIAGTIGFLGWILLVLTVIGDLAARHSAKSVVAAVPSQFIKKDELEALQSQLNKQENKLEALQSQLEEREIALNSGCDAPSQNVSATPRRRETPEASCL